MRAAKAVTVCSVDIIQARHSPNRFYVTEFNLGVQSGGTPSTWVEIVKKLKVIFPNALIDDYEKTRFERDYHPRPQDVPNPTELMRGENGLVLFRALLDAKEELALRLRYRKFKPVVADPPRMRAVYDDKAYAAALDNHDIFPETYSLTKEEIQNGALLRYFDRDQKIIIKCPRHDASMGTVIAYARDKNIPLAEDNIGYFYVVQPVIPTKGHVFSNEEGDTHYNTAFRMFVSLIDFDDGSGRRSWWGLNVRLICAPSTHNGPEGILTNRYVPGFDPENPVHPHAGPMFEDACGELLNKIGEQAEKDGLHEFMSEKVLPYLSKVLDGVFDTTIREKLHNAKEANDILRIRVLQHLLVDKDFFSYGDGTLTRDVIDVASAVGVVGQETLRPLFRKAGKIMAKIKRPDVIQELNGLCRGGLYNENDYLTRKALRLD